MHIRPTTRTDIAAVDALLAASYPALLKKDYQPSVLVTALPIISRAQPKLVTCGTYYGAFDGEALVGAGGWTFRDGSNGAIARIRHVVTDHRRQREGIGSTLMARIFTDSGQAGVRQLTCEATLTAVPFYAANGFIALRQIDVALQAGITFPAVFMTRSL